MASTTFRDKVTVVPAEWANDVNRAVYDLLGNPHSLGELRSNLGLKVNEEETARVIDGVIEGTPVGRSKPADARFTTVELTGNNEGDLFVATNKSVTDKINAATASLGSLAEQNADDVTLSGGRMDGVAIGASTPAMGKFSSLSVSRVGDGEDDVPNIARVRALVTAAVPATTATANMPPNNIAFSGGSINGVAVGLNEPAAGKFTSLQVTSSAREDKDVPSFKDVKTHVTEELEKFNSSIVKFNPAAVSITGGSIDGVAIGGGNASSGKFLLLEVDNNPGETSDNGVLNRKGVEALITKKLGEASSATTPSPAQGVAFNPAEVALTGGSANGVIIGATTPAAGTFTELKTAAIALDESAKVSSEKVAALNDKLSNPAAAWVKVSIDGTTYAMPLFELT